MVKHGISAGLVQFVERRDVFHSKKTCDPEASSPRSPAAYNQEHVSRRGLPEDCIELSLFA